MSDKIRVLELEIEKLKLEIELEKLRGKVVLKDLKPFWQPCVCPSGWEKPLTVVDPPYNPYGNGTWITSTATSGYVKVSDDKTK